MIDTIRRWPIVGVMIAIMVGIALLSTPAVTKAGIYEANAPTTYKEYWVGHKDYNGGCNADGTPTNPNGNAFYIEPHFFNKCPKTLRFTLPDDFSAATKVEIYLDLWRNYKTQAARFKLNDGATVYFPRVGQDWSRTPWVSEVNPAELKVGENTITFWGDKLYHVHDVAFRIYYTEENPLIAGPGSDVTPPTGELVSIADDVGTHAPNESRTLRVNNEKLTLKANVSADAAFVEFHAWYEGYDSDNDGNYREWHNLGRNNWFPGGTAPQPLGGVINHIGTVKPTNGTATIVWDTTPIMNQGLIKFKIRVVDSAGNVADAVGGVSADFKLTRNKPVLGFMIPNFADTGIHMSGSRPDAVSYTFTMPDSVSQFDTAFIIGAYWRNPRFSINGSAPNSANTGDDWTLGIKSFNKNALVAGTNTIIYSYSGSGPGHFVERPGPMFLLRRNTGTATDITSPEISSKVPAPGAKNVSVKSDITALLIDNVYGVDWTSLKVTVNGEDVSNRVRLGGIASRYTMVYDPPENLPFNAEIPVTVEVCDLAGNCMPVVEYSFTTAAPDTTPPQFSDIVITTRPTGAKVSWKTNEPATTRIEYGLTRDYELGEIDIADLLTSHAVELTDLNAGTLYHYRLSGVDEQGNQGRTTDATFRTSDFGSLVSDDFNACAVDTSLWQFINPLNDAAVQMNGQTLQLVVPGGVAHDWRSGRKPPRLLQAAPNGDFTLDVKFDSIPNELTQMQGIYVEESNDTYLYISYEHVIDSVDGLPKLFMYSSFFKDGVKVKGTVKSLGEITSAPVYMRLQRSANSWRWFYSTNGQTYTAANAAFEFPMSPYLIGFFAGNTGPGGGTPPAFTSVVDYFFNRATPITPEDGNPISLNLTAVGSGTVAKDPDQATYACGTPVALSATPATGWLFSGWTGDFTGTEANALVTVNGAMSVVGNFTPVPYELSVDVVNDGTGGDENQVIKNPDKPTYVYDDVVTLTASPQPGWQFVSWGGALSGTELVKTLTIRQDESVVANFKQDQYTLNVQVISSGSGTGGTVKITPQKANYVYGDVVTLTATPNPGWTFSGWTGSVTSTNLTIQHTMTGNADIQAVFSQNLYDLTVTVISGGVGVGGTVIKNPDKTHYAYGDVVALVAEPNCGWTFVEWGGAVSGSNTLQSVTITGNTAVTATFRQEKYKLTVNVDGPGTVGISPVKTDYVCGDVVRLTATPNPGNFFGGWSGSLTGAQNPVDYTIQGPTTITALFTNNQPPIVVPVADRQLRVGQLLSLNVTATDPQNDRITLSVTGLPDGASFKDNGNGTGTFSWRPGIQQQGEYPVTFVASDGRAQGSVTMTITVSGSGIGVPIIVR